MAKIVNTADLTPEAVVALNPSHGLQIYNGLDVCVTLEILEELLPQLDEVSASTYRFSRALQAPVFEMSNRGLLVDQQKRMETLSAFKRDIERLATQLNELMRDGVGVELNWRSPIQLKQFFYDILGMPVQRKRNSKGQYAPTVDREALEKFTQYMVAEIFASHMLKLRDMDKARGSLEADIDRDGRMRTQMNIAGTNTGRFASAESIFGTGGNMQNIDRRLREVFVADPGMKFANLDLEQADARNVGAICWNLFYESRGPEFAGAFLDACESGDLHTRVCNMAWTNLDWPEDPREWRAVADQIAYREMSYRDLAKRLGHGTNFRGKPPTMAKHSKVPQAMIQDFQDRYFLSFPCIKLWHEWIAAQLASHSYIITPMGRRRFFWGRPNDDATLREATAYAPQSMTADEINTGILRMWRAHKVQIMLQVHDSILIQYPEELEDEILPWALDALRVEIKLVGGRKFSVPTEAMTGWNYGYYDENKNRDGMKKWKGKDERKRERQPSSTLSIVGM